MIIKITDIKILIINLEITQKINSRKEGEEVMGIVRQELEVKNALVDPALEWDIWNCKIRVIMKCSWMNL